MLQYFDELPYTVAVVGAGSGIGKAAAELIGAMGASVGCLDKDGEAAGGDAADGAGGMHQPQAIGADIKTVGRQFRQDGVEREAEDLDGGGHQYQSQ